jgi:hypothetical protein
MEGESSQKAIKIDSKLRDELEEWLETDEAKQLGFNSMARFSTIAISEKLKKIKQKRIEHFNFHDNIIRLIDNDKPKGSPYVEVFFKNNKIICGVCNSRDCIHIVECWNNESIKKILKEKDIPKLI